MIWTLEDWVTDLDPSHVVQVFLDEAGDWGRLALKYFQLWDSLIVWPGDWCQHIQRKQGRRTGCIRIEGSVENKLILIMFGMKCRRISKWKKSNSIFSLKEKIIHTCAVVMKSSFNTGSHNYYCLVVHIMVVTAHITFLTQPYTVLGIIP